MASAAADLTEGAVYRFTNVAHGFEITAPTILGNITATRDAEDNRRLWVVEHVAGDGSAFYLRDLRYGTYMTSPITTSGQWFTTYTDKPDPQTMAFLLTDDTITNTAIQANGYRQGTDQASAGFAHANAAGQNNAPLVCWNSTDNPSRWSIELMDMSDEEINAFRAAWPHPSGSLETNRVYHLINKQYNNALKVSGKSAVGAAVNTSDNGQLWLLEEADGGMIFRNFKNGNVLCSSMKTSEPWTVEPYSDDNQKNAEMYIGETPEGYIFETQDDHNASRSQQYAHEAGGGEIVGWGTGATATFWTFTLMDNITEEDIEQRRNCWTASLNIADIEASLTELFADKACTELAPAYAAMSLADIQGSDVYAVLPDELRQMVDKVKTGDWSEIDSDNAAIQWDNEHAKKFRVQMYEPYSESVSASEMTCIWRYTNLNNPTGITANDGTTLYIMVDKAPADGASLYIAPRIYDDTVEAINQVDDGIELHEGLNVVNCFDDDALLAIYYAVKTNNGRERIRTVTKFDDIKIHIEGGSINGFFNSVGDALYTADTNEDWFYYRDRARFNRFPLLSKHCILYFDFNDVTGLNDKEQEETWPGLKNLLTRDEYNSGKFDLIATMNAWDDMFVSEMLLMGLMSDDVIAAEKAAGRDWYDPNADDDIAPNDYSEYFNNRLMGITQPSGFMSATWYRTTYHVNTMPTVVMEFPTMDLWGPAHEFGHMNQLPMNIAGCSEESNNVFSNVALFYRGSSTSRADYPSVQRENFNKGYNFHQQDTWGTTRMWFQLWLYYHAAGHNKHFYPRLYELLRDNPLVKNDPNHLNAKDDLLHFAKMACMAAGEDLTDFFDAWGFLVPQDGYYLDDYTKYYSYLTEEEIEEWRAEIARLAEENGWEKNTAIIFIDDRVGSDKPSHSEFDKTKAGEMGGLNDFINGADAVEGEYEFSINGATVTVSGATGGVGFLIYDEDGRLLGFSNDHTFDVSSEAGQKLISGQATLSVVTSDNSTVSVVDALKNASFDTKLQNLKDALARADEFDSHADYSEKLVGYLKPSMVADLKQEAGNIRNLLDNDEVTEENIDELLSAINSELVIVENLPLNEETTIALKDGGVYVFTANKAKPVGICGIQASGDGMTVVPATKGLVNVDEPAQQWLFEQTADGTGFYIRSISQDKYITIPAETETALPLSETPMKFVAKIHEPGFISLAGDVAGGNKCIHAAQTYKIVRWDDIEASQWTLTQVNDPELEAAQQALTEKIAQTRALANELAENIESIVDYELNDSHYTSNATPADNSWAALYDNDPDTYFCSNVDQDSDDGLDHHIKIQLPAPTENVEHLILKYRTRNDETETFAPAEAAIEYSADGDEWTLAHSLTQKHLPTLHNQEFESETFAVPAGTSYVRLTVSKSLHSSQMKKARAARAASDHAQFALSELGLASHQIYSEPDIATYPASNAEDVTAALRQCHNSELTLNASGSTPDDVNAALEAVDTHYQTLLKLKNNDITLGLDKINAAEKSAAIYDLQGRRLSNTARHGIYIINGKKVVVKGSAD